MLDKIIEKQRVVEKVNSQFDGGCLSEVRHDILPFYCVVAFIS